MFLSFFCKRVSGENGISHDFATWKTMALTMALWISWNHGLTDGWISSKMAGCHSPSWILISFQVLAASEVPKGWLHTKGYLTLFKILVSGMFNGILWYFKYTKWLVNILGDPWVPTCLFRKWSSLSESGGAHSFAQTIFMWTLSPCCHVFFRRHTSQRATWKYDYSTIAIICNPGVAAIVWRIAHLREGNDEIHQNWTAVLSIALHVIFFP